VLLSEPVAVGDRWAPSRVVFGPHETNLGQGRAIGDRHVAYYARRAAGGAGVIMVETASVVADDWPYERAPLAAECGPGWRVVAEACRALPPAPGAAPDHRPLILAGLGHAGGQGSSAYSQSVMWAPSRVADVVSREPPAELDEDGMRAILSGFAAAGRLAVASGLDGVEIDAGAWSLLRQFHSGLTNQRGDEYGTDRLRFTRRVLETVRQAVGSTSIVALRLSCDELAPWAGVTPDQAAEHVAALADQVDLLTVVRAGPYATGAYRPDGHTDPATNVELCRAMRAAAGGRVPVVLQGSVVDPAAAEAALAGGAADLVEMTRAQIADARLVSLVRAGQPERVRPCILCNQTCQVRDNRNPIVTCVGDPRSGHEGTDPDVDGGGATSAGTSTATTATAAGPPVLVVGAGPAGLECARVLAGHGRRVGLAERADEPGGALARAAVGPGRHQFRALTDWLVAECSRLGVEAAYGRGIDERAVAAARADGWEVVVATGSRPVDGRYAGADPAASPAIVDALAVLTEGPGSIPGGPVVIDDTVGDGVGVGLAEWLAGQGAASGRSGPVTLVCPDPVAGTLLARTGDLADANVRLQRAGVTRRLRSQIVSVAGGTVEVQDAWTGELEVLPAAVLIDCGHRLPDDELWHAAGDAAILRAGDCVAPRTVHDAILEGRRVAMALIDRAVHA
jgi:2,4-dienoyl-CoA reductase (NADPH2)